MALFKYVVEAYVASQERSAASLSRLAFWTHALGDKEIGATTPDDVDVALLALAARRR